MKTYRSDIDLDDSLEEETQVTTRLSERETHIITSHDASGKDKELRAQLVILTGVDSGMIYGLKEENIIGRDFKSDLKVQDTSVSRKHARILRAPNRRYFIEDLNSRNGTWVNGLPVTRQLPLQVGDKIRVGIKTVLLFTQQDDIELHLLELRKMESLGRLARGIAHDFNNLLATVMLNTNYLKIMADEGSVDLEELSTCVEQTELALKQAANMTEQLLGFARKGRYDERPRNLSTVIEETVYLIRRTFERSVSIQTDIQPDLWVVGDQSQLSQVMMNLCINARDAMPSGGTLNIVAKIEQLNPSDDSVPHIMAMGPHVVICVEDTGVGMNEETVSHIFEPFFSTKGLGKGNGLGLATVYGVIKSHGGEIRVDSTPEVGTRFTVYLPFAGIHEEEYIESVPERYITKDLRKSGDLVLLVEDDENLCSATTKALKRLGYSIKACKDGVEAVSTYLKHKDEICLVLLDLILPRLNGYEVFRQIKASNPNEKILIISGYSEDGQIRNLLTDGAAAFIKKPYVIEHLVNVMNKVMHERTNFQTPRTTTVCPSPYG